MDLVVLRADRVTPWIGRDALFEADVVAGGFERGRSASRIQASSRHPDKSLI